MPAKFERTQTTTHMSVTRVPTKSTLSETTSMTYGFDLLPAHGQSNIKKGYAESICRLVVIEDRHFLASVRVV